MWVEPKTNWSASDFFTAIDMNRIYGNVAYLLTHNEPDKVFTKSDIVTLGEWHWVRNNVTLMAQAVRMPYPQITDNITFDNFNNVETLIGELKQPIERRYNMTRANKYTGSSVTGRVYAGGRI